MQGVTLGKTFYSITSEKVLPSKEIQVQCCLKEAQVSAVGHNFFISPPKGMAYSLVLF